MQTVFPTVENPEKLHSEETRILTETGNQETHITKEIAENLQL